MIVRRRFLVDMHVSKSEEDKVADSHEHMVRSIRTHILNMPWALAVRVTGLVEPSKDDLTGGASAVLKYEDVMKGLENLGVDVTCESCMEIFFTGLTTNSHTGARCPKPAEVTMVETTMAREG